MLDAQLTCHRNQLVFQTFNVLLYEHLYAHKSKQTCDSLHTHLIFRNVKVLKGPHLFDFRGDVFEKVALHLENLDVLEHVNGCELVHFVSF